ncbi:HbrB-domain-containing protein [Athelia psychrophila]|uniref:HbrB-domain-containing protein n=1 Tax=Athelia psychrophila TaxID=1759441 RepID=A0A166X1J7_9AGAM|nr:HbrB-domain-containing protein [Fibularhizoctonia sp. CBS 109695]
MPNAASNPGLMPPRSSSRAESTLRDLSASMAASSSNLSTVTGSSSKAHTSPSKMTTGRTYDARLVSREMHRLGTLTNPHLGPPSTHLAPSLVPTPSASASASNITLPTLATPPPLALPSLATERDNPWGSLHVHVLPLFNGEPLRVPIEDLNALVRRHIHGVISLSPHKTLSTLENDAGELIKSGMVTLNAKFVGVEEPRLLARVVDMWGFFWDQVLPYVEGALLPLQTDPLLASLYRNPKTHRNSSPTRPSPPGPNAPPNNRDGTGAIQKSAITISAMGSAAHPHIDVRTVALRGFRDQIILPLAPRLYARLTLPNRVLENVGYLEARCTQMLLVLAFQTRSPAPPSLNFALTSPHPPPAPPPGEKALAELIRALRPLSSSSSHPNSHHPSQPASITARAPSFLSEGVPRDRRGRIAGKDQDQGRNGDRDRGERQDRQRPVPAIRLGEGQLDGEYAYGDGEETPRNVFVSSGGAGMGGGGGERERGREFIEALRSPEVPGVEPGARASVGGWGLGEDAGGRAAAEGEGDDEDASGGEGDEELTWDEAQLMVENIMIYTSKAIREAPGRLYEEYERKGFAKDRLEAEKKVKLQKEKEQTTVPKLGRKMT